MKHNFATKMLFSIFVFTCAVPVLSSIWTAWTESPSDPIYNPIPVTDGEDYFPYVVFENNKFDGNGDAFFYKMWHQGSNPSGSIALSYSNDGVNWTLKGETNLSPAYHPVVLYDKNRFGGGIYPYKMWYWTGNVGITPDVIQYAFSMDGITWTAPQPITQDLTFPIVTGVSPGYFYHLYGPGFIIYNPSATSVPGQPYTFPYVMFFDTATEGFGPGTSVEQIGLAYSSDGIAWTRYGTQPILIPSGNGTDWDATHFYRPSIIKSQGVYHMYFSGSNENIDPLTTVVYAHGIGHASSADGISWTKDPNPIFIYSDGVAWRNSRTYTPFVLFDPSCSLSSSSFAKMWFTGGTGLTTGINQGIGYATLPCPPSLSISKSFSPSEISTCETSILTITLSNPLPTAAMLTQPLVDRLPRHLDICEDIVNTCGGFVGVRGSTITLSGASIPALGSCTVSVEVSSDRPGQYTNFLPIGALQTTQGSNALPAFATLEVCEEK